jgi:hypothetical protein
MDWEGGVFASAALPKVIAAFEACGAEMIFQRPAAAAPVVQASAESLPFGDDSFDAATGVLTAHHSTPRPVPRDGLSLAQAQAP